MACCLPPQLRERPGNAWSGSVTFCQGFLTLCSTDTDSLPCHLYLLWLRWDLKQHIQPICSMAFISQPGDSFFIILFIIPFYYLVSYRFVHSVCLFCANVFVSFGGTCGVYSCIGCV